MKEHLAESSRMLQAAAHLQKRKKLSCRDCSGARPKNSELTGGVSREH